MIPKMPVFTSSIIAETRMNKGPAECARIDLSFRLFLEDPIANANQRYLLKFETNHEPTDK
jgi:hypothetical protein